MSDDRSPSLPRDRHPTCRWGASLPQRIFLLLMLGVPLPVHGQGTEMPAESMQTMPVPHRMPESRRLGSVPAVPGDAMGEPDNSEVAPGRSGSASRSMPSGQGFAPNVTGPSLAPTIDEDQANRNFGTEKTLHDARANTFDNHDGLATPIDLDLTFSGPLCTVKRQTVEVAIHGYGTVEVNEDTLHDAVVTQSGVVRSLYVFPGMEVKAGAPLVSIYSPERVNAQHMLLADFSKDEGNQISLQYFSSFSSSEKFLAQSRSNLKWWGFSDADIDSLLNTGKVREDYVFEADRDDYVAQIRKRPRQRCRSR